jgi:hypothetical protein
MTMLSPRSLRSLAVASFLAATPAFFAGCIVDDVGQDSGNITDVPHTDVERQSIGNCWLYAQASWVESMHLAATGEAFDVSQSYWTYWHWFDQIEGGWSDEVSTGGNQWTSNSLAEDRGLMWEHDFVAEDATSEMSARQDAALDKLNDELKNGRLKERSARQDGVLLRQVMDEAWGLSDEVRGQLDQAFGTDGSGSLRNNPEASDGTAIIRATDFAVQYTKRNGDSVETVETNLTTAISEWSSASYPTSTWSDDLATEQRNYLLRVQRALHDAQPVVITWDVDFNALENDEGELQGSFNMTTLEEAGVAGHQGGHMTVLEDYQAVTEEFGLLKAGETLDPNDPEDAAKLEALLLPSTQIQFLRIKNSWGALRPDREFAPGYPGYHDLYMDYLNGPIAWCPSEDHPTADNCNGTSNPLRDVMLPPGY